ncbi:hypothetical protein KP509_33G066600 [Ceratopteris richardii]|uniref:RING-type E3 ubiquitin transferase n=1 Tax=Ceratopteris richardii TaxID=49495 RepID=A0A8T2QSH7_CERRI|nr:hypothetical protein KP509_33G066600 [Ceratopteris richardii]
MEAYEVTRLVFSRVQSLEPDLASKIMGYLLLQDQGDQEMLKLAFASDLQLQAVMNKAKRQLGLSTSVVSTNAGEPPAAPLQASVSGPPYRLPGLFSSITSVASPSPLLLPPDPYSYVGDGALPPTNSAPVTPLHHHHQQQFGNGFEDAYPHSPQPDMISNLLVDKFHSEAGPNLYSRPLSVTARRPSSLSEFPLSPDSNCLSPAWKPCLYYSRGYCKHGSNCRFLHAHNALRSDPGSPNSVSSSGQRDFRFDDMIVPGSLERLEMELEELLRGRRAPVSIASLPQLYYEKYGRTLQAEGYLTESQRHGKAGFSLTKLLARLKNTITLIDSRPHGQHAVVLAEDAMRFSMYRNERDELNTVNPGSRQIYLTFPAESTFSEEDVSTYFRGYGPVQDVRIPFQQKRMFGFVTFVYPETVKAILAKGNPHHICGARVLVKPYKEKSKHGEKRLVERDHSRFFPSRSFDGREFPFSPGAQFLDDHNLLRRQINDQALEFERRRLAGLRFGDSPPMFMQAGSQVVEPVHASFGHNVNGLISSQGFSKASDDLNNIQVPSSLGYILDVLDGDPSEHEQLTEKTEVAEESEASREHNLPDSPFASPKAERSLTGTISSVAAPLDYNTDVQSLLPSELISSPTLNAENDICRICRGPFTDPIRLDCNHMFCVECILKAIRVSKDECPSCQQHIGSQVVRLLESRGIPVIDPSLTKSRVSAISNQKISSW